MISLVMYLSSAFLTKQLGCQATVLRDVRSWIIFADIPSVMIDVNKKIQWKIDIIKGQRHVLIMIVN